MDIGIPARLTRRPAFVWVRRLAEPRPVDGSAADTVAQTCRGLLLLPIAAGTLTIVGPRVAANARTWWLPIVLVGQETAFALALWGWRQAGPLALRHPLLLFTVLCGAIPVLPVVGLDSPYAFVVLGICLLAGVLYDWRGRVLFPTVAVLGWWLALALPAGGWPGRSGSAATVTFESLAGWPALMVLATVGGASRRRLLDRQVLAGRQLARADRQAAATAERARLAREMHDSVTKTLHGIGLSAQALVLWAEREPGSVGQRARELAYGAAEGLRQARELIEGLRAVTEAGDLGAMLSDLCERWSREHTATTVTTVAEPSGLLPGAREIVTIVAEALENVARHADADRVVVRLDREQDVIRVTVEDNGRGVSPGLDPAHPVGSRYGLVGMRERAALMGGELTVARRDPEGGTRLVLEIAARAEPPAQISREGDCRDQGV